MWGLLGAGAGIEKAGGLPGVPPAGSGGLWRGAGHRRVTTCPQSFSLETVPSLDSCSVLSAEDGKEPHVLDLAGRNLPGNGVATGKSIFKNDSRKVPLNSL